MIYYKNGTGTFIVTEPKPWAHENQSHFPKYDFSDNDNTPTVDVIEKYLIKNYNFQSKKEGGIKVLYNLSPTLTL